MPFDHIKPHPQTPQIRAIELWPFGQKGDTRTRQNDLKRLGDDFMRHVVTQTMMHPQAE